MYEPSIDLPRPSTTGAAGDDKISPARRSRRAQRRKAAPLERARLYGPHTPVHVTITLRHGAEPWMEVKDHRGRFFVLGDVSVVELVKKLIEGGYYVEPIHQGSRRNSHNPH